MSRNLALANVALLILYPIAWLAPLAHTKFFALLSGKSLTIFGGIADLWQTDMLLAALVALLAVVMPYAKTLLLLAVQTGRASGPKWMLALEIVGKLSMADIFLVALYIVIIKGAYVASMTPAWGLYLFTTLVLASITITYLTKRACPSPPPAP